MFKFLLLLLLFLFGLLYLPYLLLKKIGLLGNNKSKAISEDEEERLVLLTVKKQKGKVTPLDIVADSPISLDRAKAILDNFVSQSYADIKVSEDGLITYEFPSFMKANNKF